MKLQIGVLIFGLWLYCSGCGNNKLENSSPEEINEILSHVNEEDPGFTVKDVQFDSIVTRAGTRTLNGKTESIKIKLYYFGERTRGYYNLADRDQKNLQVFGLKVGDLWAMKCVTKINMEEAGGYLITQQDGSGIWSTGHVNFQTGSLSLTKQNEDYDVLTTW